MKNPVIADVSQFVEINRGMMARGFAEEEIRKIWHGNFLRVMKKTIDPKKQPSPFRYISDLSQMAAYNAAPSTP